MNPSLVKYSAIGASIALSVLSSAAFAGMHIVDMPAPATASTPATTVLPIVEAPKQRADSANELYFNVVGSGIAGGYYGFAKDVSIAEAIKLIIPASWSVNTSAAGLMDKKVSFRAQKGSDWVATLREVMAKADKSAVLNWKNSSVSVLNVKGSSKAEYKTGGITPVPVASKTGDLKRIESENENMAPVQSTSQAIKPVFNQVARESWLIPTGADISNTVSGWGDKAHWQVVWNAEHWAPDATSVVSGSFKDAVGELVKASNAQGIGLTAKFYNNNIVVFSTTDAALNK